MKRFLSCLVGITVICLVTSATGQEGDPTGRKVLERFVGVWNTEVVDNASKLNPEERKSKDTEIVTLGLRERFVIGRLQRDPGAEKSFWLMTYNPRTGSFPLWFFSSGGTMGGEWRGVWNADTKTLTSRATDTPARWTSEGTNTFPDGETVNVDVWMKDEMGSVLFHGTAKKTRQPNAAGAKALEAWSKAGKPATMPPAELKVLERLAGDWDAEMVSRPAAWTPKEERSKSSVTRRWILDGWFLHDIAAPEKDADGFSLLSYDAGEKKYRGWRFSADGTCSKMSGDWSEKEQALSFRGNGDDGQVISSMVRFISDDRHIWSVQVKDAAGKLLFDADWTVNRRKA
jgi:hypothetical protein